MSASVSKEPARKGSKEKPVKPAREQEQSARRHGAGTGRRAKEARAEREEEHQAGGKPPVDAVILWVDGNDPVLNEKRKEYLSREGISVNHSGAIATRFASSDEINYCVRSILKFAPFVRNIFIVTDKQDPDLYEEVEKYFPGRSSSIRIVDHKEIFRGYEKYLPTFNSSSIESMIWRIEGLADSFIYFNDDVFLIRETKPEDWFAGGRPVLRGRWKMAPYKKMISRSLKILINRHIRRDANYQPRLSFYLRQWNAARMLGRRYSYYFYCHIPHPLSRRQLKAYFMDNPELLKKNISYRFRSEQQFVMPSLAYHLEIIEGNRNFSGLNMVYLHPYYSLKRLEKKIRKLENDPEIKFLCVQSLEMLGEKIQKNVRSSLENILNKGRDDR